MTCVGWHNAWRVPADHGNCGKPFKGCMKHAEMRTLKEKVQWYWMQRRLP